MRHSTMFGDTLSAEQRDKIAKLRQQLPVNVEPTVALPPPEPTRVPVKGRDGPPPGVESFHEWMHLDAAAHREFARTARIEAHGTYNPNTLYRNRARGRKAR